MTTCPVSPFPLSRTSHHKVCHSWLEGTDALSSSGLVAYRSAMGRAQPPLPNPAGEPRSRPIPRGRVSEFVGGRLLMVWVVAGVLGLGLVVCAGIKLWLVVIRGTLGRDAVSLVIAGGLAFALLSISGSARKNGLRYLRGDRTVAGDLARFVARRLERRRRARGG